MNQNRPQSATYLSEINPNSLSGNNNSSMNYNVPTSGSSSNSNSNVNANGRQSRSGSLTSPGLSPFGSPPLPQNPHHVSAQMLSPSLRPVSVHPPVPTSASPPTHGHHASNNSLSNPPSTAQVRKTVYDYIVEVKIGSGSFATVWKAHHKDTKMPVAIKSINKEKIQFNRKHVENLDNEIQIMRRIQHPNVVALYDVKDSERHRYLFLEYCGGGDLSKLFKHHGPLSEIDAKRFLGQLALGLAQLRSQNIVHRDLKPQNLLLNINSSNLAEVTLKIADFGFARYMEDDNLAATLCGSPLYMAPEILGYKEYDANADLWSVGGIFFEMLFGRTPFTGSNHIQLLQKINNTELAFPSSASKISSSCKSLLVALLKRNPKERMTFESFFLHPYVIEAMAMSQPTQQVAFSPPLAPYTGSGASGPTLSATSSRNNSPNLTPSQMHRSNIPPFLLPDTQASPNPPFNTSNSELYDNAAASQDQEYFIVNNPATANGDLEKLRATPVFDPASAPPRAALEQRGLAELQNLFLLSQFLRFRHQDPDISILASGKSLRAFLTAIGISFEFLRPDPVPTKDAFLFDNFLKFYNMLSYSLHTNLELLLTNYALPPAAAERLIEIYKQFSADFPVIHFQEIKYIFDDFFQRLFDASIGFASPNQNILPPDVSLFDFLDLEHDFVKSLHEASKQSELSSPDFILDKSSEGSFIELNVPLQLSFMLFFRFLGISLLFSLRWFFVFPKFVTYVFTGLSSPNLGAVNSASYSLPSVSLAHIIFSTLVKLLSSKGDYKMVSLTSLPICNFISSKSVKDISIGDPKIINLSSRCHKYIDDLKISHIRPFASTSIYPQSAIETAVNLYTDTYSFLATICPPPTLRQDAAFYDIFQNLFHDIPPSITDSFRLSSDFKDFSHTLSHPRIFSDLLHVVEDEFLSQIILCSLHDFFRILQKRIDLTHELTREFESTCPDEVKLSTTELSYKYIVALRSTLNPQSTPDYREALRSVQTEIYRLSSSDLESEKQKEIDSFQSEIKGQLLGRTNPKS